MQSVNQYFCCATLTNLEFCFELFLRFHSRLMVKNIVLVQFLFNIIGINATFSFGDYRFKTLVVKLGQACSTVKEPNFQV